MCALLALTFTGVAAPSAMSASAEGGNPFSNELGQKAQQETTPTQTTATTATTETNTSSGLQNADRRGHRRSRAGCGDRVCDRARRAPGRAGGGCPADRGEIHTRRGREAASPPREGEGRAAATQAQPIAALSRSEIAARPARVAGRGSPCGRVGEPEARARHAGRAAVSLPPIQALGSGGATLPEAGGPGSAGAGAVAAANPAASLSLRPHPRYPRSSARSSPRRCGRESTA